MSVLTGCAPLINDVARQSLSPRGALVLEGKHGVGFTYMHAEGYVRGEPMMGASDFQKLHRCKNTAAVSVQATAGVPSGATDLICEWAPDALPVPMKRRIRFEVRLVRAGQGHLARAISLAPLTPLTLRLVVPWYEDREQTRSNFVSLLSHEAYHVHWFSEQPNAPQDEITAYWVGLCAQMSAGVNLTESHLPGIEITGVGETSERSSRAAERVRETAARLLAEGELSAHSSLGTDLLAECDKAWQVGPQATRWWTEPEPTMK